MQPVLMILGPLLALATAFVLAKGILGMGRGGGLQGARASNRMMRWRVGLQFGALLAFMLLYALTTKGS